MPGNDRSPGCTTTPGPTMIQTAHYDDHGQPTDEAGPGPGDDVEWRVQWRRAGWSAITGTKSRRFARRAELDRWVKDRLLADDGRRWPRVTNVRISWRYVGPWQTGRPMARCGRPTTAGPPCRTVVGEQGDACRWHAP